METNANKLIYIVDDDPVFLKMLQAFLLKEVPGIEIKTFPTGEACMHEMYQNPLAVILDYSLNSEFPYAWNGVQVLKRIDQAFPSANIIIVSSQTKVEVALDCIRQGALEYVMKDEKSFESIKQLLLNLIDDLVEY
jgi:two-component system OmpR family response regulator